jgi:hypothetical protein
MLKKFFTQNVEGTNPQLWDSKADKYQCEHSQSFLCGPFLLSGCFQDHFPQYAEILGNVFSKINGVNMFSKITVLVT